MRKLFVTVLRATLPAVFAFVLLTGVVAAAPGLPQQMVGPVWRLVSYQGADGQVSDVSANEITIRFAADGTVSGSGGCNGYRGTYTADAGGALTLSQVVATLRACVEENKTAWETRYFAALQTVSAFKLDADRVQLVFANGAGLLTFGPVQPAPGGALPGMPVTGAGTPPLWPAALGALIVVLAGLAGRVRSRSARLPPDPKPKGEALAVHFPPSRRGKESQGGQARVLRFPNWPMWAAATPLGTGSCARLPKDHTKRAEFPREQRFGL